MSKLNLSQMETIACLLNGCHIVWTQSNGPGQAYYRVFLDQGINPDCCLGRLTHSTIESLWSKGFLQVVGEPRSDKNGNIIRVLKLDVPKLPVFTLDREVSGDD